ERGRRGRIAPPDHSRHHGLHSFVGKISRAASRNKKIVAVAAWRLRFPCRYQAGTVRSDGSLAGYASGLVVTQCRDVSGPKPGKLDAIPLPNYVYCAEQV